MLRPEMSVIKGHLVFIPLYSFRGEQKKTERKQRKKKNTRINEDEQTDTNLRLVCKRLSLLRD